ncbi:hydroxyacid dehydrogenase [Nonomuraea longicatena]|uniref:Hydroxyacid dehydrogenase n=1 Tax=Nonomuraea longicatena TaxID=83682 RepID=A0ABP4AZC8_9ACTN
MRKAAFVLSPAVFDDVYGPSMARIRTMTEVMHEPPGPIDPADMADVRVLFSSWGAPVLDQTLLDAAPRLEIVLYAAGSVRAITTPEFWARGIPLVSAYQGNAVPVADFTLAQITLALKGAFQYALRARADRAPATLVERPGLYGSRVGLLSLGAVGRMVADRLRPFNVEVLAHDPYARSYPGVRLVGIEELFATCDVVSVHTPLLPATRGLVGRELLDSMKLGATLINTARGAVIDEHALVDVLTERPDLFAALDVTDPEPPEPGSPLFTLPNVMLTPHIAGALGGERGALGELVVDELARFLAGEPLRHALTERSAALLA